MKWTKKRSKLRERMAETHFFRRGTALLIDFFLIYLLSLPLYAALFYVLTSFDPEYKSSMEDIKKLFTIKSKDEELSPLGELLLKKTEEEIERRIQENRNTLRHKDLTPNEKQQLLAKVIEDEEKLEKIREKKRELGSAEEPEERLKEGLAASTESVVASFEQYRWVQEILVAYIYFTLFFFFKGQTPGKRMLGLKVVKRDGSKLTFWEAFERSHGYTCSLLLLFMGFFQVLWDKHSLTMHDKIAETRVIRIRKRKKEKRLKRKSPQKKPDLEKEKVGE